MIVRRHLLPAGLAAGAAAGAAEFGSQIGALGGKMFSAGLRAGPSAILGAISGIFYSAIYDILPHCTGLPNLRNHAIAVIGSAVATFGLAFAAASAGLIAMPSLATLGLLFAAAISANMVFRAIFGGQHPRQALTVQPQPGAARQPQPVPQQPQAQPKPAPTLNRWFWPADLGQIGINQADKQQLEEYLQEARSDLTNGIIPTIQRKQQLFAYNGKFWTLPRTLSFVEDPKTNRVAAILLTVSKDRVPPLGKGRVRTPKVIYNLTTGQRMCKKAMQKAYEVELLKALNGSKGIEPLTYIRKVRNKTQLITPLFKGSVQQLLKSNTPISAKDIKDMMLSLLKGLATLHAKPGKEPFPPYFSYHSDIKPDNLLFNRQPAGYDAVISDVESVNDLERIYGTMGWMSPEKIRYWNGPLRESSYNKTHGQHDDIWSMGLVFASMLKNQLHELRHDTRFERYGARVAPLACLYQKCQFKLTENRFDDSSVAHLTQQELNREINQLIAEALFKPDGAALEKMWDIVRRMLFIDYNRRMSAREAKEALESIPIN
ncbi:MAG: hypothetical protein LLG04_13070 [Parachlamydia sp.]|nr:hypothetical protein [Parachlamydia sp.]